MPKEYELYGRRRATSSQKLRIYVVAIPCIAYPHVFATSEKEAIESARQALKSYALYDSRWGRVSEDPQVIEIRDEG